MDSSAFILVAAGIDDWASGYRKTQKERQELTLELSSRFQTMYPNNFNLEQFNERAGVK